MLVIDLGCHDSWALSDIKIPPELLVVCIALQDITGSKVHIQLSFLYPILLYEHNKNLISSLSHREKEVISCICEGKSYDEIARELSISVRTVHQHIENLKDKLDARNCAHIDSKVLGSSAESYS